MQAIAGWVAPAATMIAAMMTAANLGARVTGWGFAVFCVGSLAWLVVALFTGQQNLLLTNAFLLLVNVAGVWRWLGRQARYEDGGRTAARRSASAPVPSLFSASALAGMQVTGADGETLGTIVDAMLRCGRNDIAYLVISDGGSAGLAETLRAVPPDLVTFGEAGAHADLDRSAFERISAIAPDRWPEKLPT